MTPNILYAFDKVLKTIRSCHTLNELHTANRMRIAFNKMFIYGRLAHLTADHDKAEFYSKQLMDEYIIKMGKLNEQSKNKASCTT